MRVDESESVCFILQFLPEANEVTFARKSVFGGSSLKLDYLTKPSFFEDFGFVTKVKMADRVKPDDELFVVGYPYFNVNGTFFLSSWPLIQLIHLEYIRICLVIRDAGGGRTVQRSCVEHVSEADYFQWGA